METVRLQHATNIPRCLSLATTHSAAEELGGPTHRGEDLPMILASEETPDTETRELDHEAHTARKLILVIAGLLFTWMPYFIWLPVSTLLVSWRTKPFYEFANFGVYLILRILDEVKYKELTQETVSNLKIPRI